MAGAEAEEFEEGGRGVRMSRLGKVHFPERGLTKGDVVRCRGSSAALRSFSAKVKPTLSPEARSAGLRCAGVGRSAGCEAKDATRAGSPEPPGRTQPGGRRRTGGDTKRLWRDRETGRVSGGQDPVKQEPGSRPAASADAMERISRLSGEGGRQFQAVADGALCALRERPTTLQRSPDGATGESFFQKRAPRNLPGWIPTARVTSPSGRHAGRLEAGLELAERHERDLGLGDRPYPPDHPKVAGEPLRVQPSRARRETG